MLTQKTLVFVDGSYDFYLLIFFFLVLMIYLCDFCTKALLRCKFFRALIIKKQAPQVGGYINIATITEWCIYYSSEFSELE